MVMDGYSDTIFLIPELISGVQFKKGPYYAEEGDFSAAGAANINYVNQLDRPLLRVSGGTQGWALLFGAASERVATGAHLAACACDTSGPEHSSKTTRYGRGPRPS